MQGIIYRLDQPLKALQLKVPLEGKYLLRPVHSSTMTSARQSANDPLSFRFFSESDRSVVFCFCPTDSLSAAAAGHAWGRATQLVEQGAAPEEIGRFVWSNSTVGTTINDISMFFRGSATLTEDLYLNVGRLRTTVDAKGMAILSSEPGGDRAGRALAAYMLGLAYHQVMEQAIHDLAECCRDDSKVNGTEAMHAEISRFIASYYFEAPARVFTTEVGPLYAAIRERLLLTSLSHELVDQLGRIAEIIRVERTAAESAFEAKLQRRLTIFGVFIGLLGLAQLTQTTPAQIQTFATGWKTAFRAGPAIPVLSPEQQSSLTKQPDEHTEVPPHKTKRVRHDASAQNDIH
ncbi:hypothetical protein PQQ99_21395 [Paraburkholderia sediminicola]|uniref:hypothetical protein n=1 Tax=Paraburkholderia sediminicola TaxID=458836 RepID=UPI0038BE068F